MSRGPLVALFLLLTIAILGVTEVSGGFDTILHRHANMPANAAYPVTTRAIPSEASGPPIGRDRVLAATARPPGGAPGPLRTLLNIQSPMSYGEFVWNDAGVPDGPAWIRVDLGQQIISVFRGGHEIGTSVILYGADKKPTPIGDFPILAMMKDHVSAQYGDAPMPYTLRLTPDGVAIHGSNVRWGAATHGCIGVPKDFAARLFDVVEVGDPVTVVPASPKAG